MLLNIRIPTINFPFFVFQNRIIKVNEDTRVSVINLLDSKGEYTKASDAFSLAEKRVIYKAG